MISIYKFTNISNAKIYIGSTKNFKKRLILHKCLSLKTNKSYYIYNAIRKYGWNQFLIEIVELCCPLLRNVRENYWISYYKTMDSEFGYNMRTADNTVVSEETKKKLSIASKKSSGFTGRKHSEDSRKRIGLSQIGRVDSEIALEHKRLAQKGHFTKEETKIKYLKVIRNIGKK